MRMIKDYAFWVIGVIESKDPETALHTIKHENNGGLGQRYLPQLAMASDDQYNVLINRLAHNYGERHLAVDYIASAYQDFTKSIKLDSSDQDFTPLDVLIALGFTGSSITGATIRAHQQFSEYSAEYTYGSHKDLATFIYQIEPNKAQTDEIITNFYKHYCAFRDRIMDDPNLYEHLNSLGIDVHSMISPRVKRSQFVQIYQDLSNRSGPDTKPAHSLLDTERNNVLSFVRSRITGDSTSLTIRRDSHRSSAPPRL
jgi:hypothetical protein